LTSQEKIGHAIFTSGVSKIRIPDAFIKFTIGRRNKMLFHNAVLYARVSSLEANNEYRRKEIADFQARFNTAQGGKKWLTIDAYKQSQHETFRAFELIKKTSISIEKHTIDPSSS
jgi:hypothetical protein